MLDPSIQSILDETEQHMKKTLEHLRTELSHLRAGRATPSIIEDVRVDYYGTNMPLNQVASVSAPAPDLLVIQPWDRSAMTAIEKAIQSANLGLNPSNDGQLIRIPFPPPSEERRLELVKAARSRGEDSRIAVRNIRRAAKDDIKKTQKDENLSEDMRFEGEELLQKLTDDYIAKVDRILDRKEEEIMEV
jgi:ribosome recycling factor